MDRIQPQPLFVGLSAFCFAFLLSWSFIYIVIHPMVFGVTPSPSPQPTVSPTLFPATPTPSPSLTPLPTPKPRPKTDQPLVETPVPTALLTPSPNPTPSSIPSNPIEIDTLLHTYANSQGISYDLLKKIAVCESNLNPNAVNGPYAGLYQFSSSSWTSTRTHMNQDINPNLRFNAEESIKTAAFKIATSGTQAWANCD